MFLTGFPSVPPGLVTISQSVCLQTDNQPLISTQCHGRSLPSSTRSRRQPRYIKNAHCAEKELAVLLLTHSVVNLQESLELGIPVEPNCGLKVFSLFSISDLVEPVSGSGRAACEHAVSTAVSYVMDTFSSLNVSSVQN